MKSFTKHIKLIDEIKSHPGNPITFQSCNMVLLDEQISHYGEFVDYLIGSYKGNNVLVAMGYMFEKKTHYHIFKVNWKGQEIITSSIDGVIDGIKSLISLSLPNDQVKHNISIKGSANIKETQFSNVLPYGIIESYYNSTTNDTTFLKSCISHLLTSNGMDVGKVYNRSIPGGHRLEYVHIRTGHVPIIVTELLKQLRPYFKYVEAYVCKSGYLAVQYNS